MRDAGKRLDDVEAALTPKQQVLRWLDHVAGLGSEEAYFKWLAERSREAVQPAAAAAARYWGDLAKADVLWDIGQREAAVRLWRSRAGVGMRDRE
ncbi:MAG TPA: hypothetical protein VM238_13510 [Phycisphaerae bacterium]|nr:hypothetical protein [Phycisphaerae bacterium]